MFFLRREYRDRANTTWMLVCVGLVMLVPIVLGFGLLFKSSLLLENYHLTDLLFSKTWKPNEGKFGFYPFIVGSLWVTVLSILISTPVCILAAIYVTEYSRKYFIRVIHPVIDILAGIPSVVYGVWGILVIVPFISRYLGPLFGVKTLGYSVLAGAFVLSVMIIPFILNILIEIFRTVPLEMKEASYSLGSTKLQTIKHVVLKKNLPGIIAAVGFGLARAFGETMAVLMVVGNMVQIPKNVFDAGYPLPALIANNYGEMLSIPKYDSALMFAALLLFAVVIFFNALMRLLINKYEKF